MKRLIILLVILLPISIFCQIINIPGDYSTIQQGIDAAANGDTVIVDTGVYRLNDKTLNFQGKNITVASMFLIIPDSTYINQTKIVGIEGSVLFMFESGEDSTSVLKGFTLMTGRVGIHCKNNSNPVIDNLVIANFYHYERDKEKVAAVYCESSNPVIKNVKIINNESNVSVSWITCNNSSPTISNVLFEGNYGSNMISIYNISSPTIREVTIKNNLGGGIFMHGPSNSLIEDIIIVGNSAHDGTGIYIGTTSSPTIRNIRISENEASGRGAGIYCYNATATIQNAFISDNIAWLEGGVAIYSNSSNIQLQNAIITNNYTWSRGGGISCTDSFLEIENITISSNTSGYGGAIWSNRSNIVMANSVVWDNLPDEVFGFAGDTILIDYSNIKDGWEGVGNIDQGPLFVGYGEHPYQINDYSPCIDAGTPDTTGLNLPEYDLAGEVRVFNDRVDMGAYEWNTFVGMNEPIVKVQNLIVQAYPNPFTSSTTLSYSLPQPSAVQIFIFNHVGKQVDFIQQKQPEGKQQVSWDATGLPSGVYFFRMQAGEEVASGKMVLVKY